MTWEVGDLAAFDHGSEPCVWCAAEYALGLADGDYGPDEVLEVTAVHPPEPDDPRIGLSFAIDLPGEGSCACGFRKVVKDKHEACEDEFTALLKRRKSPAQHEHIMDGLGDD